MTAQPTGDDTSTVPSVLVLSRRSRPRVCVTAAGDINCAASSVDLDLGSVGGRGGVAAPTGGEGGGTGRGGGVDGLARRLPFFLFFFFLPRLRRLPVLDATEAGAWHFHRQAQRTTASNHTVSIRTTRTQAQPQPQPQGHIHTTTATRPQPRDHSHETTATATATRPQPRDHSHSHSHSHSRRITERAATPPRHAPRAPPSARSPPPG